MNELKIVYAMMYRQLRRYLRARSRLAGTLINPLMFFIFFGVGWSASLRGAVAKQMFEGLDYLTFLAPGIVMMAVFTASLVGGISVIWDREFGFLKEVLVAPASRTYAIVGRALGDSISSVLQGLMILLLLYILVPSLRLEGLPFTVVVAFITAMTFNGLGIAIASKMRSPEGFQLIMNLVTLPLIFLSGAFYPIENLPEYAKLIFYVNPLTFSVDLTRHLLTGRGSLNPFVDLIILVALSFAFLGFSVRVFKESTID